MQNFLHLSLLPDQSHKNTDIDKILIHFYFKTIFNYIQSRYPCCDGRDTNNYVYKITVEGKKNDAKFRKN